MDHRQTIRSHFMLKYIKKHWQQNYRPFIQGIRTALAIMIVLIIYLFFPRNEVIWMGACALGLAQTCIRTPHWRFELNMLFAYLITIFLILCAYPFSHTPILSALYSFILVFLVFIFAYYKKNSLYLFWTYFIPQYSLFAQKSFASTISDISMCSIAFLICLFVCGIILRPEIKTECIYETCSSYNTLISYLIAEEKFIFHKSQKTNLKFAHKRVQMIQYIQRLRLLTHEVKSTVKPQSGMANNYFAHILLLHDQFIEIIIEISMQLRLLEQQIQHHEKIKNIFHLMRSMIHTWLKYLECDKTLSRHEIEDMLEKFHSQIDSLTLQDKNEIYFIILQLKDNISLLNTRFKQYESF